jgi:hypothetical protein
LPKKGMGMHSVGVARFGAGQDCQLQTLVLLTLARGEVAVMVALRLFLPESWTNDPARLERAGVPVEYQTAHGRSRRSLSLTSIGIPRLRSRSTLSGLSSTGRVPFGASLVSGTFPIISRWQPKTCWPMPSGGSLPLNLHSSRGFFPSAC